MKKDSKYSEKRKLKIDKKAIVTLRSARELQSVRGGYELDPGQGNPQIQKI